MAKMNLILKVSIVSVLLLLPLVSSQKCALDLLILMDSSGSINWLDSGNYDRIKTFINTILDHPQFDIDNGLTRVGLIYYSNDPRVAFTLDTYQRKIDIQNAVLSIEYLGFKTDTSAALRLAKTHIFQTNLADRPKVILIMTDGESTSNPPDTVEVAQSLRVDDLVNIFTIGITNNVNEKEIRDMSGLGGTRTPGVLNANYFLSPTFTFDEALIRSISEAVCSDEVISVPLQPSTLSFQPTQPGTSPPQPTQLSTTQSQPPQSSTVLSQSFQPGMCALDLLILMDSSGSINWLDSGNYGHLKTFVNTLLDHPQFDIDNGLTRVGLMYFSNDPRVAFTLDTYQRKIDIQNAVLNVEYLGFKTDTSAALRLAKTHIFQTNLADRPNVAKVILIMTDGESTSDPPDTVQVAQSLRVDDLINIFTIGITNNVNEKEIRDMSGLGGTRTPGVLNVNYFLSPTFAFDETLIRSISEAVCSDEVISVPFQLSTLPSLPIQFSPLLFQQTRRSTLQSQPIKPSTLISQSIQPGVCALDLLILIDSSGSINRFDSAKYDRIKIFINTILDHPQFDIDNGFTRVGLIYYSNYPVVAFTLDTYQRKIDVQNAVLSVKYLGLKTDTSAALRLAKTHIYQDSPTDRSNVAKVILVMTDGESTSDPPDTVEVAQSLRVDDLVNIFTVGITNNVNEKKIRDMSGLGGTSTPGVLNVNYFLSPTFTFEETLFRSISQAVCSDEVVSLSPFPSQPTQSSTLPSQPTQPSTLSQKLMSSTLPHQPTQPSSLQSHPTQPSTLPSQPTQPSTLSQKLQPRTLSHQPPRPSTPQSQPTQPSTLPSQPPQPSNLPSQPVQPSTLPSQPPRSSALVGRGMDTTVISGLVVGIFILVVIVVIIVVICKNFKFSVSKRDSPASVSDLRTAITTVSQKCSDSRYEDLPSYRPTPSNYEKIIETGHHYTPCSKVTEIGHQYTSLEGSKSCKENFQQKMENSCDCVRNNEQEDQGYVNKIVIT